jgi:hypothetical protein
MSIVLQEQVRNLRGDDGKVMQWCGPSRLLMCYTLFQPEAYLTLPIDALVRHNSAILTAKAIFRWNRSTS